MSLKSLKIILKSVSYYWKQWITASLVLLCLTALGFCLFKITHALLTKPIPNTGPSKWSHSPQKTSYNSNSYTKDLFPVSLEVFEPYVEQVDLQEKKNYSIIKIIEAKNPQMQCYLGDFQLIKKEANRLLFRSINQFLGRKFEQYSAFMQKPIKFQVLAQEQISSKILNCKNWIFIENRYENTANIPIDSTIRLNFKHSKCIQMSSELIAARSFTPNTVYFRYNPLGKKVLMCLKDKGNGLVQTMELGAKNLQTLRVLTSSAKK